MVNSHSKCPRCHEWCFGAQGKRHRCEPLKGMSDLDARKIEDRLSWHGFSQLSDLGFRKPVKQD